MRRIVLWAMSTITVLVLLFSYSTSRSSTAVVAAESRQVTTTSKTSESSGSSSGSSSASSGDSSGQEPAAADDGTADDTSDSGAASGATGTTGSGSSGSGSSGSGSSGSGSSSSSGSTTVEGDAVMTRFGNVQVKITVSSGKITAAEVLQVPWEDRHDQMINSRAVPVYNEETVQAQSASIDVVSGATVTWEGYTQSLQSAIDRANI